MFVKAKNKKQDSTLRLQRKKTNKEELAMLFQDNSGITDRAVSMGAAGSSGQRNLGAKMSTIFVSYPPPPPPVLALPVYSLSPTTPALKVFYAATGVPGATAGSPCPLNSENPATVANDRSCF